MRGMSVDCPVCGAMAGAQCFDGPVSRTAPNLDRVVAADTEQRAGTDKMLDLFRSAVRAFAGASTGAGSTCPACGGVLSAVIGKGAAVAFICATCAAAGKRRGELS